MKKIVSLAIGLAFIVAGCVVGYRALRGTESVHVERLSVDSIESDKSPASVKITSDFLDDVPTKEKLGKALQEIVSAPKPKYSDEELAEANRKLEELRRDYLERLARYKERSRYRKPLKGVGEPGNAWDYYSEVFAKFQPTDVKVLDILTAYQELPTGNSESDRLRLRSCGCKDLADLAGKTAELLDRYRDVVSLMQKGTLQDNVNPPWQFEKGIEMAGPSLLLTQMAIEISIAHAKMLEREGKLNDAVGQYLTTLQFSQDIGLHGPLLSHLVGTIGPTMIEKPLMNLFSAREIPPEQLAEFARGIDTLLETKSSMTDSMELEYLWAADTVFNHEKELREDFLKHDSVNLAKPQLVEFLVSTDRYYKTYATSSVSATEKLTNEIASSRSHNPLYAVIVGPTIISADVAYSARLTVMKIAIHVKLYRETKGSLPQRLEDLVIEGCLPTIPNDPFDGGLLKYRLSPDGSEATIYSVGKDLIDNGGALGNKDDIGIAIRL